MRNVKTVAVQFMNGFFSPARGLALILSRPRIRLFAILPFGLTAVIFIGGGVSSFRYLSVLVPSAVESALGFLGVHPGPFVYWPLWIIAWLAAVFAVFYGLFILTRLIAAPFYGLLAERVLIEEGALPDEPFRLGPWLGIMLRMLGVSIARAVLFTAIGVVLFAMSFIPMLGFLSATGFLLIVALDLADYAFEALRMSLRQRLRFFRCHFPVFLGFALALGLVFLIPGLNFFLFPASVAGASDLVRRFLDDPQSDCPRGFFESARW